MSASRSSYRQLQPEDRVTIASLLLQRHSVRSIARLLGRSASTVSREIARNSVSSDGYASRQAQQQWLYRRRSTRSDPKLHSQGILWFLVLHFLRLRWSPEQIALTLARLYPKGHELRVSHETIYNCIYAQPVGELRKELIATLRHAHNKRLPRSKGQDRRGQIPDMLSIHVRPPEVEDRQFPGHWEGVLGAKIWDLLRPCIRHGALWDPGSAGGPVALREDVLLQTASHLKWFTVAMDPVFDSTDAWIRTVHIFTDCTLSKVRETVQQKMMEAMASDMPISDVMRIACREFERLTPDVAISILGVDDQGRLQTLAAPSLPGYFSRAVDGQQTGPMVGACGAAAHFGEAVLVQDLATDPRTEAFKQLLLPLGWRAVWSSPIKARDGRVLGTFAFYYHARRGPDAFHRFLVDVAIHLCAIALEGNVSRARIHQLAYYDGLTGLPGRQSILTRLEQAIAAAQRSAKPLAVVVLNLGHVREINNLFGEGAGDELLCETARRLERCMVEEQVVGRLAGDEFAVILPDCDQGSALAVSRDLLSALSEPFRIKRGNTLRPTAAVGISVFPEHGSDRTMLLQGADLAMYHAKQAGGSEIRLFSQELVQEQRYRLSVEAALREAISGNQLELHYQPKVDLQNGALWGVEALARWHDPRLGQVPPSSFVPIAEEYGLIDELSHWVLREACRQLAAWRAKGVAIPVVAINMSPTNFRNSRLPGLIDETLAQYGLRPSDVLIEMTEGIFMDATPETAAVMEVLRRAGIRLSIDDFGVGYSNLERLRRLPISEIKLDRSFIQNLEVDAASKALVDAVIQIGKSLDFAVIAEGVEREAQRQILLDHGCRYGQGYLFARPLPPDGVEEWARNHMSPAAI